MGAAVADPVADEPVAIVQADDQGDALAEGDASGDDATAPDAAASDDAPSDGEAPATSEDDVTADGAGDEGDPDDEPTADDDPAPDDEPAASAVPADAVASGTVGEAGWMWYLEDNGDGTTTMRFAYTGETDPAPALAIPANFSANIADALGTNKESVTKLVVPEGATSIGDSAFFGLTGLKEAEIGSTVTTIGARVFGSDLTGGGAKGLEKVTFATREVENDDGTTQQVSDLTSIGQGTFAGTSITELDLSNTKLAAVSSNLCNGCEELVTVKLPETVSGTLGSSAFWDCEKLTSVNLEDTSITAIGAEAFYYCSALGGVTFPSTVTNIGNDAYNGCSALKIADFSAITGISGTTLTIGARAFYGAGIEELTLPDKTNNIGAYAFYNCKSLTSVDMPARCQLTGGMGVNVFANCTALEEMTFRTAEGRAKNASNGYFIPNYTLSGDTALKTLDLSGWDNYTSTFQLNNVFLNNDLSNLKEIVLPTNTNITITSTSFQNKTGLSSMDVFTNPERVNTIQASAFKGSGITEADLTNWKALTAINQETFSNCANLTSVTIPQGVTTIGSLAFSNDQQLADVTVRSKNLTNVSTTNLFDGSGRIETVTIGKEVERLTGNFLVNVPPTADVKFEGESIIRITKSPRCPVGRARSRTLTAPTG